MRHACTAAMRAKRTKAGGIEATAGYGTFVSLVFRDSFPFARRTPACMNLRKPGAMLHVWCDTNHFAIVSAFVEGACNLPRDSISSAGRVAGRAGPTAHTFPSAG